MTSNTSPSKQYFAYWSTSPTLRPILSHSLLWATILFLSATDSLPIARSTLSSLMANLSLLLLRTTFLVTALLSFLHQSGALRRYALHFAECELSKIMNGTLVTLSDLRVDVWRGQVILVDLVIHNHQRDIWEWESPCLARIGRLEVTLNFLSAIELPFYGPLPNHTFKDVHTALIEDVQVFVEKRRNVFNFHLLDGDLDIPDAGLVMEEYRRRKGNHLGLMHPLRGEDAGSASASGQGTSTSAAAQPNAATGQIDDSDSFLTLSQSMSYTNTNTDEDRLDTSLSRDGGSQSREKLDEAAVIVERLVGAVSNLGRAATDGGSKALHSAIKNQKDSLVKSMKMLHSSTIGGAGAGGDANEGSASKPKKDKVAEGVSVIRQLGKVVEQNVTDIKDQMSFLQKPPKRKEGLPKKKMDIVRIGSLLLREMRIFTKDVLVQKNNATTVNGISNAADAAAAPNENNNTNTSNTPIGWSRPIVLWELAITGAEFSPPMTARDSQTGLPVVGIPVDRAADIILKRLMTEAAKSNTGRLLETAFGDVFAFMNVKSVKGS